MVKVTVKGGLWKNAEDEILKAAVMKYGLNSWEKIASLLVQKTATQCKARWFEWLDPSINKAEWSKQEDERLLQLCKVFPSQWRTISSLVGRTAFQCLERFNILLAAGDSAVQTADVALAESLPSRPDLARLPQEDLAMIDEARARIANIKGRKDRRQERQRAVDAVRQASIIQRNRELQAAGLVKKVSGISKNTPVAPTVPLPDIKEAEKVAPMNTEELKGHFKTIGAQKVKEDRRPVRQPAAFKINKSSVSLESILDLPPVLEKQRKTVLSATDDVATLLASLPASAFEPAPASRKRAPCCEASDPGAKRPRTEEPTDSKIRKATHLNEEFSFRKTLPHPGSKKLMNVYRELDAGAVVEREAVAMMIRDAIHNPVPIQGRPPAVSDVPTEAEELFDSESLRQARDLIDSEIGVFDIDQIRNLLGDIYSPESLSLSARKLLPMSRHQWEVINREIVKDKAELAERLRLSQERLTASLVRIDRLQSSLAESEFDGTILDLRTEDEVMRTRELIHQWMEVCEAQRRRKRELVAQTA